MICFDPTECKLLDNEGKCSRRPTEYMFFVERQGYCADSGRYADPEKQAAIDKVKQQKTRIGQQKQRRKK